MNKQGVLTIISGFSGSGKGTVVKVLCEKYNYVIYWQIELTGGRTLRVRKVSNNNPLHQQTSNRVPRYAGNTRRLNWRMV